MTFLQIANLLTHAPISKKKVSITKIDVPPLLDVPFFSVSVAILVIWLRKAANAITEIRWARRKAVPHEEDFLNEIRASEMVHDADEVVYALERGEDYGELGTWVIEA